MYKRQGDDYDNVKTMADSVNQKLGRDVIVLTGARTDINKLIAPCKLFVGVSLSLIHIFFRGCGSLKTANTETT